MTTERPGEAAGGPGPRVVRVWRPAGLIWLLSFCESDADNMRGVISSDAENVAAVTIR